jgi:hypothetical protein
MHQRLTDTILCVIAFCGAVFASQNVFRSSDNLSWTTCGSLSTYNLQCGRLSVPFDYARPNIGSFSLSIIRLLADTEKRRGSLYANFGGPGIQGTGDYFRQRAVEMMEQSGGEYDIVRYTLKETILVVLCES